MSLWQCWRTLSKSSPINSVPKPKSANFHPFPPQSRFSTDSLGSLKRRKRITRRRNAWVLYPATIILLSGAGIIAYKEYQPFRYFLLASIRCSRVAHAAMLGVVDYKLTFSKKFENEDDDKVARSRCHRRSAERVLEALLANGGIFIKLGQHMASLSALPKEWTSTMRPLQDQCEPTPYEALEELFMHDMGKPISELFENFDSQPIGVASLAQVHRAIHRETGKEVAVKLQHPHLAEFCDIDMEMVEVTLGWIKYWFPEFEFTWLGEEMRVNLPKEMDFVHEAQNALRAAKDFEKIRTSLYIPKVIAANKRVLIMEFIRGARVDDLDYLAEKGIDRNKVSLELARIFNQMVFVNGWFHADPHPGNLLIRPSSSISKSPYNFEIVLLDHGLYFDLSPQLRVNYSKLWLALIAPATPQTIADRRKYAELVGNVGPELYPIFEAAITGRAGMEGSWDDSTTSTKSNVKRVSGLIDVLPQTEAEMESIRNAIINKEGLLLSVFDVLRRVPRRVLMVLKLNDLTRSLDHALATTHSNIRVFLVTIRYCSLAVWHDDRRRILESMKDKGFFSLRLWKEYASRWWIYEKTYRGVQFVEFFMDLQSYMVKSRAWTGGLLRNGLGGARRAAAGLA